MDHRERTGGGVHCGEMNSHLTLRLRRAVAIMATLATGLLTGLNASRAADERAGALDKAIPAAMERAGFVGIVQDITRIISPNHPFSNLPKK